MSQENQFKGGDAEVDEFLKEQCAKPHPQTLKEVGTLFVILITGILGAIIGMELMVNLGISANTSIIGALIAVMIGLIPIKAFNHFQNIHRQNLVETSISASTFTAGNVFMLALGTIWFLGEKDLILPMIIGCSIGVIIDIAVMYWLFDTPAFPASGTWPAGIATAETIISVARRGKRSLLLVVTSVAGAVGQYFRIPMDIFGVCWIGNIWALLMFGIGLLIAGYSTKIFGFKIGDLYVPHGIMIGAGIVALIQLGILLIKKSKKEDAGEQTADKEVYVPTKSSKETGVALQRGAVLFLAGAIIMAIVAGVYSSMSIPMFILWILFTGLTSVIAELLIGTAAMHAGWFPAMATSLIFLVLGMLLRFPPVALALLVGYKVCTGPAFADMGYDLKTGWILRRRGSNKVFELEGRRQQFHAEFLGVVIGIIVAILSYQRYFNEGLIPPAAKVFAATIQAGTSPEILKNLLIFAVVGGIIQAIGGTKRQIGVLFATGLLIGSPFGGIAALTAIVARVILKKVFGEKIENTLAISAAGFIVGSSVFSFMNGTIRTIKKRIF
ncbi:membrane protein [Spirochaetia bacterium]|nr:membrane protein [Spirochaetia bacterium]